MRKLSTLFCILMPLMLTAQQAMMQLDNIPGDKEVSVTNWVPVVNSVVGDILAIQPYTNRVHAIEARTNAWNTAYSWGDHAGLYRAIGWVPSWGDLTDIPQDFPPSTHEHDYTAITNPPWLTEYTETDEAALAALAAYAAYWPPDSTPSQYFSFTTNNNAITITGYDEAGGVDVRIPSYINGWPVKVIGDEAFFESDIESVHGDVVTIGDEAFLFCASLAAASFPQATTIGNGAFSSCAALAAASFPQATTIGDNAFFYCASLVDIALGTDAANFHADAFAYTDANPTITISNPHAKGWGETFAGLAVVRPDLYADAFHGSGANLTGVTKPVDIADRPTFAQVTNVVDAAIDALPATIYSDISAAAAATAVIVSNTPIYTLSISSASVISNDTSALFFDGNAARWELWVDFAATDALGSTFAANMDFVGCEPELTVTGCYKFAVSTVDGITMQARQTYPTRYEWRVASVGAPQANAETRISQSQAYVTHRFSANATAPTFFPLERVAPGPSLYRIPHDIGAFTNGTAVSVYSSSYYNTGNLVASYNIDTGWYKTIAVTTVAGASGYSSDTYLTVVYHSNVTDNRLIYVQGRQMNELEIKAYSAGWRP